MRDSILAMQPVLSAVVEALGYEWVGMEFHPRAHNALLRVYIDHSEGITLDDCQRVSHQISGVLDVEDPIAGRYTLEISSPGLDRPLFTAAHFQRFTGAQARLHLRELVQGRRKISGCLNGVSDNEVLIIDSDGKEWRIALWQIDKARLVPQF